MTLKRSGNDLVNEYRIPVQEAESAGDYLLITETVDEENCNPLKIWHDLGEPAHLTKEQTALIKAGATPKIATGRIPAFNGKAAFDIEVKENGVVYFELKNAPVIPDRGYDYNRVMQKES